MVSENVCLRFALFLFLTYFKCSYYHVVFRASRSMALDVRSLALQWFFLQTWQEIASRKSQWLERQRIPVALGSESLHHCRAITQILAKDGWMLLFLQLCLSNSIFAWKFWSVKSFFLLTVQVCINFSLWRLQHQILRFVSLRVARHWPHFEIG